MKVLHRKRPELIPLFDQNIRRCCSDLGSKPSPGTRSGFIWIMPCTGYPDAAQGRKSTIPNRPPSLRLNIASILELPLTVI